jgi:hypothetical protein
VENRPDESGLVFSIYLCLFLVYPIIVFNLFYQPTVFSYWIPSEWTIQWTVAWTIPFLLLSVIVGLGYISIHREAENLAVYFYDNSKDTESKLKPFRNNETIPWLDEDLKDGEGSYYWILRFTYYWPFEFTVPLPHDDWERIEVWVDATSGKMKWVVSDYHYREIWYKAKNPDLDYLCVEILPNFHTPIPLLDIEMVKKTQEHLDSYKPSKQINPKLASTSTVIYFLKMWLRLKVFLIKTKNKIVRKADNNESQDTKESNLIEDFIEKTCCYKVRYKDGVEHKENDRFSYLDNSACSGEKLGNSDLAK